MPIHRRTVALALGAVLTVAAATAALAPSLVSAQQPPPPPPRHERPVHHSHIEGRIAFLHAELKITPAQEAQFERMAAVMRTNATQRTQRFEQMRADKDNDKPRTAVDSLERHVRFIEAQATAEKSFADAFKPLYATLSDEQKKTADELLARSFHGPRGRHGRG